MFEKQLMQGQRILVTGGGTGLGQAMAEKFLELGADVAICGRRKAVCDATADAWRAQAPLGWDTSDCAPVAETVLFLLAPGSRAITGEIIHVDGGFHAIGAAR